MILLYFHYCPCAVAPIISVNFIIFIIISVSLLLSVYLITTIRMHILLFSVIKVTLP